MSESRQNYKKSDIRLELVSELRKRSMTFAEVRKFLSSKYILYGHVPARYNISTYEVCDRTVKRELDSIKDNYKNQLYFDKEFNTYKLDLYDFPDTIEDTEIQALDVALQKVSHNKNAKKLLESLKTKLTSRLYIKIQNTEPSKATQKIYNAEQHINSNYAFVGPHLTVKFDEKTKSVLDSAINKQHEVRFNYYKKEVVVRPLGIIDGPNNVYLIAYDYKNSEYCDTPRHYILAAISHLIDTEVWFERDNNFSVKTYAESMFGIYNDGKVYDVEWLIKKPSTIRTAKQYNFHPTQQFIDNPDGSLTIKMHTGGLRAISMYLAQWGGDIIPIKPKELLEDYMQLLKKCEDSIKDL